ncbi:MAG TPA: metallophosphoesterase [Blastocatellia bacterium]|nr:metallophosphoesterase [Blastocatellia bacterium]
MKFRIPATAILSVLVLLTMAAIPTLPCLKAAALASRHLKVGTGAAAQWYFALSGDSRDCGDLIMPKIAKSIETNRGKTPVEFYWHLGDMRRIFGIDCDIIKRKYPSFDCAHRPPKGPSQNEMKEYLNTAWDDFIQQQLAPFDKTPVFVGIGNHELLKGSRSDFRLKFKKWLTQEPLPLQRSIDAGSGVASNEGDTYYHFIKNGVDFIYLDNADRNSFSPEQVKWLIEILTLDSKNPEVKTIVAGMHEALPYSTSRDHGMDASCQGICSGEQVYNLLYQARSMAGKRVYVFASHSHYFQENIFDTPEHQGNVLPGWIVGTAGAEQYRQEIRYGYLLVGVRPDGTLSPRFVAITRESAPPATGPGAEELTSFCFEQNKVAPGKAPVDTFKGGCACGEAK